ncbi:MAG: AMP-binding protein [Actinomadura sp.]
MEDPLKSRHDDYHRAGYWRDQTFLDDLRAGVRRHPHKPAVITRDVATGISRTLDYAELELLTDRCAAALVNLGLAPGDVVAAQLPNRWELVPFTLGCIKAGLRLCPFVPIYGPRELAHMLRLTEARVFITMVASDNVPLADVAIRLAGELPELAHVFVAGGERSDRGPSFEQYFLGTAWEENNPVRGRELPPDDPFLVLFTSGTTGEAKGALHTQNTLYAPIRAEADVYRLDAGLRMTVASGYMHYSGMVQGVLMPLMLGGTAIFQAEWTGPSLLELIEDHRVNFLYLVPTTLLDLIEAQRENPRDTSSLRHIVTGSAAVPPHFVEEVRDLFGIRLHALWGMTENGPVTMTRPDDPEDWAAFSDGRPVDGMEVRITPIPGESANNLGRLWVRGPTQCLGYYRREELYAEYLDEDGWFNTEDLAVDDGRGGIRIAGRDKDLIMHHAIPVPAVEVEAVLIRHPAIREVAVVGLPDANGDEVVCAVVTSMDEPPTLADLRDYLGASGLTEIYWPERLEAVEALPKTLTGKVRKTELQERFRRT